MFMYVTFTFMFLAEGFLPSSLNIPHANFFLLRLYFGKGSGTKNAKEWYFKPSALLLLDYLNCVYVCMYIYIYTYIYTQFIYSIYIYIYIHTYIQVHLKKYIISWKRAIFCHSFQKLKPIYRFITHRVKYFKPLFLEILMIMAYRLYGFNENPKFSVSENVNIT